MTHATDFLKQLEAFEALSAEIEKEENAEVPDLKKIEMLRIISVGFGERLVQICDALLRETSM